LYEESVKRVIQHIKKKNQPAERGKIKAQHTADTKIFLLSQPPFTYITLVE